MPKSSPLTSFDKIVFLELRGVQQSSSFERVDNGQEKVSQDCEGKNR